ncbi:hypothetical protein FRC07_008325 [Ceratobasidium sp. 392]|nr:hypothetical protein FRC07_008325 [Ceratobasidium sp. 392]
MKVLGAEAGERYQHSFMDDLESFFWVLFYTVVGHTNPGVQNLDPAAKKILDRLDDPSMDSVWRAKSFHLKRFHEHPEETTEKLRKLTNNSWASDDILIQLLIRLGSFFYDNEELELESMKPEEGFPKIVDMFIEALEKM